MAKRKDCVFSLLEQARASVVCIILPSGIK